MIGDVKVEKGTALAAEFGDSALFQELDVTSEDQFAAALTVAVETWGTFDILVNNAAAIFPAAPIEKTTNEEFDLLMTVNVRGVFLSCKLAYP
jgi:NAD(P)-dependent dehydrogenase (short-subunit alcohol dehydrogenase family)